MKVKKINIVKERPRVTDEEIHAYMNFDSVVKRAKAGRNGFSNLFSRVTLRNVSLLIGIPTIVGLIYVASKTDPVPSETPQLPSTTVTVDSAKVEESGALPPPLNSGNEQRLIDRPAVTEKKFPIDKVPAPDTSSTRPEFVYAEPEPVNGYPHLYDYFYSELRYPEQAVLDSVQGVVTVSFVINKEGKPSQIKLLKSLSPDCDAEAIRLIENMPPWKPATLNGKPVPARRSVPLTFQIIPPRHED